MLNFFKKQFDNKDKKIDRTILFYILFQSFFSLLLWIPIFFVFQVESGLREDQIFFIQSVYYLVFVAFELPTGFIADKIGHKWAMVFGAFFLTLSNFIPVFFSSYLGFMVHFLFIALARALVSGSSSSFLFDYLKKKGESDQYKKIEGKARSTGLILRIILWPISSYLMTLLSSLPYILTGVNSFIAFLLALKLPSHCLEVQKHDSHEWEFKLLFKTIVKNPLLLFFMVQGAGIFVLQRLCMVQLYQPLLKHQGFSLSSFGIMMSLSTVFEAIGAYQGHRFKKFFKDETLVFVMTALTGLCFLIMIIPIKAITVLGLALFSLFAGIAFPVQKQLLNDHIKLPRYRASILSIESLGDRLLCSLAASLIGIAFKNHWSTQAIFISFFLFTIPFLVSLFIWRKSLSKEM